MGRDSGSLQYRLPNQTARSAAWANISGAIGAVWTNAVSLGCVVLSREEDGLPTSTISERVQQVGGTLTGVLDRMEERGLVRRERDLRDRRIWRIWLTELGQQLQEELPPIAQDIRDRAMEGISKAEQERLSQLIDRAIANLS